MHTINFNDVYRLPIDVGNGSVLTVTGVVKDITLKQPEYSLCNDYRTYRESVFVRPEGFFSEEITITFKIVRDGITQPRQEQESNQPVPMESHQQKRLESK